MNWLFACFYLFFTAWFYATFLEFWNARRPWWATIAVGATLFANAFCCGMYIVRAINS